jgi:hypothetical protein
LPQPRRLDRRDNRVVRRVVAQLGATVPHPLIGIEPTAKLRSSDRLVDQHVAVALDQRHAVDLTAPDLVRDRAAADADRARKISFRD